MNYQLQKMLLENRVIAWLIDYAIIIALTIPLMILFLFFRSNIYYACFILSFLYSLILCKDIFGGQSFGKYKYHIKIVNIKDQPARSWQLVLRNLIFLLLAPVEFILSLVKPERRLGDMIVGTKLIVDNEQNEKFNINRKGIIIILFITLVVFLLCFSIYSFLNSFERIGNLLKLLYY